MKYLSSCSIVKNEAPYIMEFYQIHKKLGVESFLFFDRSTIGKPLKEIFAGCDDVEIIHFPEPNKHAQAWKAGAQHFKGKSKWVQFIDIDEVVVPMKTNDIKVMLQDYEAWGTLGLNWHTFGANGLEVEPEISTYSAYTKRANGKTSINNHIQSIVQVDFIKDVVWGDPHHPTMMPGQLQVNEKKKPFNGPFNNPPSQDIGFIAHYYTRSREYWANKIARGRADTNTPYDNAKNHNEMFDQHQLYMNEIEDITVKNIWEK